jgi:hypothetical protein
MTKTCAGVCAITEREVCGFNGTTAKRFDQDETSSTAAMAAAERQVSSCGGVVDKRGTCCAANELDCTNLCSGSATVECGVCVGGSSGMETYVDDCGKCVEGSTGVPVRPPSHHALSTKAFSFLSSFFLPSNPPQPNADKDCQDRCFGNATRDDCNVCYLPGDGFEPNSWQDCAGVCNGTAVLDDCAVCALGTTRREFNVDKDCAGQCFGQHVITDPYALLAPTPSTPN